MTGFMSWLYIDITSGLDRR